MHSSQVPVELQSAPVEELMDYVVEHIVQWSEQQGWCAVRCRAPCRPSLPHTGPTMDYAPWGSFQEAKDPCCS